MNQWYWSSLLVLSFLIFSASVPLVGNARIVAATESWPHRVVKMQHEIVIPAALLETPQVLEETARRICQQYDMIISPRRAYLRKRSDGICFAAANDTCETWVMVFECHAKGHTA